ncbi:MAG: ATP-binding protein [Ruminococcus sp.]|nr:ATP-binding protein [Ruminococcus sp.]
MDSEIFDRAQIIMAQRRNKAQAENERRIQEINKKIPEIAQINEALFNTGKDLIRIISESKGKDVAAQIEQIKQNNLGAQQVAGNLLTFYGYPADYLDIHYMCPQCNDTGYNGNSFCTCMKNLFSKLTAEKMNEKSVLSLSSFETFSLKFYEGDDYFAMEKLLEYAEKYASDFSTKSDNILIYGKAGLGKTHISLAIANVVIQKGFSVIYDSAINILRDIEKEHFSYDKSTEMLDTITSSDLLIMDDLGTEFESKFYISAVYNIVNSRIIKNKPTIINTNMTVEDISKRYGGKVASRIGGMYTVLEFRGSDIRYKKKYSETYEK